MVARGGSARRKQAAPRVLQEIRRLQKSTDLLMRKLPFYRLVREVATRVSGQQWRWQLQALECLQRKLNFSYQNIKNTFAININFLI